MKGIREGYGVPAYRGARILFRGEPCVITGTTREQMYLRIRPLAGGRSFAVHPTWAIDWPVSTTQDVAP
jgi:hypothetical protein